jgi:large conductance mechanosensitive channel
MWQEFKTFAMRGNVVDLAVGIILGTAFTGIVTSLVSDMLMPPLGLLVGGLDFSDYFVVLKGEHTLPNLAAAKAAGAVTLNYGLFINAIIRFLILAFAIFMLVRQLNKIVKVNAPPPGPTPGEKLLAEIRDLLKDQRTQP